MTTTRSTALLSFFVMLHALVLVPFLSGSASRIAEGVLLASLIPLGLAGKYLVDRFGRPMTWLDFWVLMYALWSVASGLLYLQADAPSRPPAYAYGLYHFILPVACYFAAKAVPREQHARIISAIVLLNAFALAYGIYLHVARPNYYLGYLQSALAVSGELEEWQLFARMQSYMGSTSMGYIGAATVVLVTLTVPRVRHFLPVIALVSIAGTVLTLQRASLVALAVALVYLAVVYRPGARTRLFLFATLAAAVTYGAMNLYRVPDVVQEAITGRFTTDLVDGLVLFFQERGYDEGIAYLKRYPLGVGLGATSSAAENAGHALQGEVPDANFMRIAADLGPVGLAFLLIVLACAAWRAVGSRHTAAWITFLVIHCGIMLSTNVFDSFYISHCFWLLLAFLDSDREPAAELQTQTAGGPTPGSSPLIPAWTARDA